MNEKFEQEQKQEVGKNIFQRDFYYRHGEKLDSGELAPEGFEQGKNIGRNIDREPKPYGSDDLNKRAISFATAIQKTAGSREITMAPEKYKPRIRKELGRSGIPKEFLAQWIQKSKKEGGVAVLEWYLSFGKNRPDANCISPHEMANGVAKNILTHSKMAERYRNGSKIDLVNGSHTPVLDVFIAIALKEQLEKEPINPEGKNLTEKMGGRFKTAEGFEVDTNIDNNGKKSLILKFRGKEFNLDEKRLEEMVEDFEKTKEKQ